MPGSNAAPSGRFEAVYASAFPSGSVAFTVNSSRSLSLTVLSPIWSRTGGLFVLFTLMVMFFRSVSSPSLTSNCISLYVPAWSNVGVHENVLVCGSNVAPSGRLDAEYVSMSLSGSVAFTVNSSREFSLTDLSPIWSRTGGLFVLFTMMVMFSRSVNSPSLTSNCTSGYVPACSKAGVHENVFVVELNTAPSGRLNAEYVSVSPSGSVAFTVNSSREFSLTDLSPIWSRTGGLFVRFTLIVMFSQSVNSPSPISKCTSGYVPAWLKAGVHENVLVFGLNTAPSGRFEAEYDRTSASGSAAFMVNSSK